MALTCFDHQRETYFDLWYWGHFPWKIYHVLAPEVLILLFGLAAFPQTVVYCSHHGCWGGSHTKPALKIVTPDSSLSMWYKLFVAFVHKLPVKRIFSCSLDQSNQCFLQLLCCSQVTMAVGALGSHTKSPSSKIWIVWPRGWCDVRLGTKVTQSFSYAGNILF